MGTPSIVMGALTRQLFSYGRKWHIVNLPEQAIGSYLIFQVYSDNPWVLGQFDRICLDREAHQIERLFIFDLPYISGITAIIVFVMLLGVYFFVQSELRGIYLNLIMLLMMFFLWMLGASSTIYLWLDLVARSIDCILSASCRYKCALSSHH